MHGGLDVRVGNIWSMRTHHAVLYSTSVSNRQESQLDYSEEEPDAADVLPLLRPLTPAAFTLFLHQRLYTPVLGCRIHTAMTAIHLSGTLSSESPACGSAMLPYGHLPDSDSVFDHRFLWRINFKPLLGNLA